MAPVEAPIQTMLVLENTAASEVGWEIVIVPFLLHPTPSVTVIEYVFGLRFETEDVVWLIIDHR